MGDLNVSIELIIENWTESWNQMPFLNSCIQAKFLLMFDISTRIQNLQTIPLPAWDFCLHTIVWRCRVSFENSIKPMKYQSFSTDTKTVFSFFLLIRQFLNNKRTNLSKPLMPTFSTWQFLIFRAMETFLSIPWKYWGSILSLKEVEGI